MVLQYADLTGGNEKSDSSAVIQKKAPVKSKARSKRGFKMLFTNKVQLMELGKVMTNTFAMSTIGIATSLLPVLFAVLLNEIKCSWFKKLVQTLTTIPNFISWVLVYSVAFNLFSSTGLINNLLQEWHITTEAVKFLDSGKHVYLTMWLWSTWKGLGWGAIIYLATIHIQY